MDYLIMYSVLDSFGKVLKQGKIKVKNKISELHAKSALEDYMKSKYDLFDRIIIYETKEETKAVKFFRDELGIDLNDFKK